MSEGWPHLFSPFQLRGRTVRNRIAFASMFSGRARGGDVTRELIQFYENRARGGAALIVTEPVVALRHAVAFAGQVSLYRRSSLTGLREWTRAIHSHDTLVLAQLQDPGRGDVRPRRKAFALAPSALPDDLSWTVPHAMTREEIHAIRDDFIAAAHTAESAGFDGVEISSGHGHLYHQFLSPWMNRREDEYGGDLANRMRALTELIAGIRDACSPDFMVGIRLPGCDGVPGSIDWEEAARITDALTRSCAPDYVNFVQGSQAWTLHMHVPDLHQPRGTYIEEIARLRPACNGVPLAATGRIIEPAQAEGLLSQRKADFVMIGRALLTDASWGAKARAGRDAEIRKCVSCNNCWGEVVHQGRPLACDNNPRVADVRENDWRPVRTRRPRRLTVVGAGIAGLEVAWIAAARGHDVTVFSQSAAPGGKVRRFASVPGCDAISAIVDYQMQAAQRAGVRFELGREARLEDIAETRPDAVVVAGGGRMLWPASLPVAWREWDVIRDLWSLIDELPRIASSPSTAVLYDFDGTDVTYSVAEALARRFARVVLLNPVETLARDEPLVQRQAIHQRLLRAGVQSLQWSEPSARTDLEEGRVVARNLLTGSETCITDVGLFAYATPREPRNELVRPLRDAGYETHVIGDAVLPRSTMLILREAHELGERILADPASSSASIRHEVGTGVSIHAS